FSAAATSAGLLASCAGPGRPGARAARRRTVSPNEKLNIALIGGGGRGFDNASELTSENIVAICDVDRARAAKGFQKFPTAVHYDDFRVMLEKEKNIDAVVVSTPDHTHAIAAVTAMRLGKHVYCEKPLARTIFETRWMRRVAREERVATQMG